MQKHVDDMTEEFKLDSSEAAADIIEASSDRTEKRIIWGKLVDQKRSNHGSLKCATELLFEWQRRGGFTDQYPFLRLATIEGRFGYQNFADNCNRSFSVVSTTRARLRGRSVALNWKRGHLK